MYKVLILDDDRLIRERLKSSIAWERIGLVLAGEAENGESAMELFREHAPKIVVADIHIPGRSGLEVAEEMAALDPEARFLVITGYNDFQYVQGAVKLGAVDLLSKPIMADDINRSLQKAVHHLDALRRNRISSAKINALLEESLPMLQEKFIGNLLSPECGLTEKEVLGRMGRIGLALASDSYEAALIVPDLSRVRAEDLERTLVAVKNLAEETLGEAGYRVYTFFDPLYRLICVAGHDGSSATELDAVLSRLRDKVKFYFELDLCAGVGLPVGKATELCGSFCGAAEALEHIAVFGENNVACVRDVVRTDAPEGDGCRTELKKALDGLKAGDPRKIEEGFDRLSAKVVSRSMGNLELVKKVYIEYVAAVFRMCAEQGVDMGQVGGELDVYYRILSLYNLRDIQRLIARLGAQAAGLLAGKRSSRRNRLVENAKRYIQDHLRDEGLDLRAVSAHVELSPIYFCQLFSRETGMGFNEYVNAEKISRAKELLLSTNRKVYQIADDVGYPNPKYFNVVFKRMTGLTPLEFRDQDDQGTGVGTGPT